MVLATAARVIYEVPHIDSEEADMDKHSTSSSRGSSQWVSVSALPAKTPVHKCCMESNSSNLERGKKNVWRKLTSSLLIV